MVSNDWAISPEVLGCHESRKHSTRKACPTLRKTLPFDAHPPHLLPFCQGESTVFTKGAFMVQVHMQAVGDVQRQRGGKDAGGLL